MKKPNEDRLDEMIRKNNLKGNLIKWWNVNFKVPDQQEGNADGTPADNKDAFSENNTALYEAVLKDNSRDEDPFEKAMKQVQKEEKGVE